MNPMDGPTHALQVMEPASPEALLPDASWWPWLAAAAAIAVLGWLAILVIRKNQRPVATPRAMRNAAFGEAVRALAAATTRDARDAAVQASLIVRQYLAAAAGDPALYQTHEEFIARHDALQGVTAATRAAAQAGFSRLAALKYAPDVPAVAAAEVLAESRALLETLHHGFTA